MPESQRERADVPSEMEQKVAVWADTLMRTIPREDLRAAYDFALDHHDEGRVMNALDLRRAYPAFVSERRRAEEKGADSKLNACAHCGVGIVEGATERMAGVWIPTRGEDVMFPCAVCRPKAFREAWKQWHERNQVDAPVGTLASVVVAGKKLLGDTLRCDACGREINTYTSRKVAGATCGGLLDSHLNEGDDGKGPSLCEGKFEKAQ
jgi:hypothetical protein